MQIIAIKIIAKRLFKNKTYFAKLIVVVIRVQLFERVA
jgi:hypothetical protein